MPHGVRSHMTLRSKRMVNLIIFFFSSRRRHTRCSRDWSSDVCSSDLSQKKSHLLCVQPRGAAGGRCRAEKWRDAVSAPVALRFKLLPTQSHCEARSNVVAEGHGAQEEIGRASCRERV